MSVNNTNGQVDTNGFDVTFAGTLTGPGNLFKSGAGTLLITGSNSAYAGQTEFPVTTGGGVIETTTINALGSGNFRVQANGTLRTTNDLTIGAIRGTSVLTKTGAGKLTVTGSTGGNLNAGASIVVNQGSVQMDSLTGLGGNNSATAIQMPITLNSGTELLLNWSSSSESRFSKNINLNDATITRMN